MKIINDKTMKKIYLALSLFFVIQSMFSQQYSNYYNNIVPPSPTVAELAKYTTTPVSPYTGTPNISIPMGELRCGKLVVPVSISYHAGGIRVDDVASNVGLGWSLNAGGVINQTIKKCDDVSSTRYIMTFDDVYSGNYLSASKIHTLKSDIDSEPDIFSYNFLDYNGQFLMDKDHQFYNIREKQDLVFSMTNGREIKAVDLYGNSYYFSAIETARPVTTWYTCDLVNDPTRLLQRSGTSGPLPSVSAYFLTRMVSADNKYSIDFNYIDEDYSVETKLSGSIYFNCHLNKWEGRGEYTVESPYNDGNQTGKIPSANFYKSNIQYQTKKIQSIIASTGEQFEFTYKSTQRTDLTNSKALYSVYYKDNGIVKRWIFNQDYFISDVKITGTSEQQAQNYRLKLVSLYEEAPKREGNYSRKTYQFGYYGEASGEPIMPYRNAMCGQDAWGYCNAATSEAAAKNVNNLFPKLTKLNNPDKTIIEGFLSGNETEQQQINKMQFSSGSNREANGTYMKAYSLKNIIYPTGGKSEFIYEPHDYRYSCYFTGNRVTAETLTGGQRIKEIKHYVTNDISTFQKYEYRDGNYSSGTLVNEPNFISQTILPLANPPVYNFDLVFGVFLKMNSNSFTSMYSIGGDYIGYKKVTEITGEGKTVYDYYSMIDFPQKYDLYLYCQYGEKDGPKNSQRISLPLPVRYYGTGSTTYIFEPTNAGYTGQIYGRGLIKSKALYDIQDRFVSSETFKYDFSDTRKIYGMEVMKLPFVTMPIASGYEDTDIGIYYYQLGKAQLISKENKEQRDTADVSFSEKYQYNDYDLISEKRTILSSSDSLVQIIHYPSDINSSVYNSMVSKRMINYPVETVTKRKGNVSGGNLLTYQSLNSTYLPEKSYMPTNNLSSNFQYYNGATKDSRYGDPEYTVSRYDDRNNVQEVTDKTGIPHVFIWNNKNQLMAEIHNVTYQTVNTLCPNLATSTSPSSIIDAVRNQIASAEVTTYTYSLNTISSVTNPRGIITKYEYDPFGRLESQKDFNDNIIAYYRYQYKNQ
jgi:YD repeat-containing protein